MPVPPPPPAPPPPAPGGPPPPPPPAFSQGRSAAPNLKPSSGGRGALLADIHKGARLKKVTEVNDRSAPVIDAKKNADTGNGRSAMAPPSGGLFAGGFPVLKPSGNKKSPQLPKASFPKLQDQLSNNEKLDLPKAPPSSAPATIACRPPPPRPTILSHSPPVPPSLPPSSSKPQLNVSSSAAPPPPPPPYKERSPKLGVVSGAPPPPPPPFSPQDKSARTQRPPSQSFPPPPPLPLHPPPAPPKGYAGRRSPSPDYRDHAPPPPPPPPLPPNRIDAPSDLPPPPPPFNPMTMSARRRLSEPLPPPPNLTVDYNNAPNEPPRLPPGKPSIPPVPGHGRPHRAAGNNGGRLAPPPPPPVRSPSTGLSSSQPSNLLSSGWNSSTPQIYRPASLGNLSLDDFESKFTFHSVEDLPPPELFQPCERIYPSKCGHGPSMPPPQRPQIR